MVSVDMGWSENDAMIVIVEDQRSDAKLIKRALIKAQVDAPIELFEEGETAFAFVKDRWDAASAAGRSGVRPILILLDLKLPGISGFEILERLKGAGTHRRIPVVVFTSSGELEDVERAYELGANGYIVKPLDIQGYDQVAMQLKSYWLKQNVPPPAPMLA